MYPYTAITATGTTRSANSAELGGAPQNVGKTKLTKLMQPSPTAMTQKNVPGTIPKTKVRTMFSAARGDNGVRLS